MRVDRWKLDMWFVGPIQTKITLSRFASYFALCYGAGLDVLASLRISEDIAGNAVIRRGIQQISTGIADGKSLSVAIEATEAISAAGSTNGDNGRIDRSAGYCTTERQLFLRS